jgi:hypothetical protein
MRTSGGQLGRPSSAKFRACHRLKAYAEQVAGSLFDQPDLHKALEDMLHYPLTQATVDRLNRHLRAGINDEMLAALVLLLRNENRLCVISEDGVFAEPRIICSMGLKQEP